MCFFADLCIVHLNTQLATTYIHSSMLRAILKSAFGPNLYRMPLRQSAGKAKALLPSYQINLWRLGDVYIICLGSFYRFTAAF